LSLTVDIRRGKLHPARDSALNDWGTAMLKKQDDWRLQLQFL
jgi:hypothetical protein